MEFARKPQFSKDSGLAVYYAKRGVYGGMGLEVGQLFRTSFHLEKSYHDSYHRAGVGTDFCTLDTQGAYSCMISGNSQYDQNADDGHTVRFEAPTFKTANTAMEQSLKSKTPLRLFTRTYRDEPDSFTATPYYEYRGLFIVSSYEKNTKVYVLTPTTTKEGAGAPQGHHRIPLKSS